MQLWRFSCAALLCASTAVFAQATGGVPKQATGQCKDGTYTTNPKKSDACKGHKGVKDWYNTVGGQVDPDIKSGRTNSSKANRDAANSDSTVNPRSDSNVSNARANAINKKSGNAAAATPDDNGKTMPGPAANGAAGANQNGTVAGRHGQAAPGGGPGLVWLNTSSNTYHCYGTQYYGKTKNGKYVPEQEAVNAGAKPDRGKSCSEK